MNEYFPEPKSSGERVKVELMIKILNLVLVILLEYQYTKTFLQDSIKECSKGTSSIEFEILIIIANYIL